VADCLQIGLSSEAEKASYERKYRNTPPRRSRASPTKLNVDICSQQRALVKGRYPLQNKTSKPVTDIIVTQTTRGHHALRSKRVQSCRTASWASTATSWPRRWRRAPQLAMDFEFAIRRKASSAWGDTPVMANGTFFNNAIMPHIGYQQELELTTPRDRKKHGLPRANALPRDDPAGWPTTSPATTPTGSPSTPPSAPAPTRPRLRRACWSRTGPARAAATSTTRWTSPS
jgi:hypothetical protein